MLRFNLHTDIAATGELGPFNISNEVSVRFVIENAGAGNTILVSGRITGQRSWDSLGTLTGLVDEVILVDTYDEIRLTCTVFDSTGSSVRAIACSFDK